MKIRKILIGLSISTLSTVSILDIWNIDKVKAESVRDFQEIKYTVKRNDNHYNGRGQGLPSAIQDSPNTHDFKISLASPSICCLRVGSI